MRLNLELILCCASQEATQKVKQIIYFIYFGLIQVVELYAFGYDAEAQVLLNDINDDEELGRLLLEIAGRRLNLYANSSQSTFLKIASVGHQLLAYLDNLVRNFDVCGKQSSTAYYFPEGTTDREQYSDRSH